MEINNEHRLTALEERAKSNSHRLDEVEKRQDDLEELTSTVKVLAIREEQVESDVKEIKSDVKTLTEKPGKRWDGLVEKIILTVAAAIVAYILGRMGIGA